MFDNDVKCTIYIFLLILFVGLCIVGSMYATEKYARTLNQKGAYMGNSYTGEQYESIN